MFPLVIIIVLNWNNARDTLACLESLAKVDYPNCRILVVDNGSTDDSVARIREAWPEVEILETGENLGYAGGNNAGIRHALAQGAEYICILNNDVVVAPDFLSALVQVAESDPQAGILGPVVLDAGTPDRIQSAGMRLNVLGDAVRVGAGERIPFVLDSGLSVDAVAGCAMLVRVEAIQRVGLLDEQFFMYREEVDWCLRVKHAGYKILIVPAARVWHRETPGGSARYVRATYYMTRNAYLLMAKRAVPWAVRARVLARDLLWLANWTLNPKWHHKRAERDALFWALIDVWRGRWGKMPADVEKVCYSKG